jgi:2-polyprenyl-3-methyl-5-hydroxy-6-metoxy-1,4-benzoquinol methylase
VKEQRDIAGESYWTEEWSGAFDHKAEDERDQGWRNHVTLQFDRLFTRFLPRAKAPGRALQVTEIGCARSRWLPYFARRFGAKVSGLDYSELGCQQAREVLNVAGVAGEISHGDLFAPPENMVRAADVVLSWGLVEHFEDTANVVAALERFVRPGGLLITVIPNMTGMVGTVQRWMNERIFKLHVPIDREQLAAALAGKQGQLLFNDYYVTCNFWTVNPGKPPDMRTGLLARLVFRALTLFTVAVWLFERAFGVRLPATRRLSPYIVSIWRVGEQPDSANAP